MKWLTKLRTRLGYEEPTQTINLDGRKEAITARDNAWAALGEARQRREEVHKVTTSLAELRARNHFGESIEIAMMRREKRS